MRAVTQSTYGGTDTLHVNEIPVPTPGPREALVRVRAVGIDRGTVHLMTGLPYAVRLGFGLRRPKAAVIGRDLAGVVEAVGDEVTSVAVGDEIIGSARGSLAQFAVVPESRLSPKPASLSFEEASVLPISGSTALQAVRDAGRIEPGNRVLVIGASGGVGSFAVQIAAAHGAEVIGVASAAKADLVRALGANRVIDYTREDIDVHGPYDVIIDLAGLRTIARLRRSLTANGTLVIAGGEGGDRWLGGAHRQIGAAALSPFVRHRITALISKERAADFAELASLVEAGSVRPALDRVYSLDRTADAVADLAAGKVRGKTAVRL